MIIEAIDKQHPENHRLIATQASEWADVDEVYLGKTCVIIITIPRAGLSAPVALHRLRRYPTTEVYQL